MYEVPETTARRSRSLAVSAVLVTSLVALTAGCASSKPTRPAAVSLPTSPKSIAIKPAAVAATPTPTSTPTPTVTQAPASAYSATVPTISDGSSTVVINGRAVTFPSTVTDAAWSPNGTRLAYVDGDGNITVAFPDGTHTQTLTKAAAGVKRARPTWDGPDISFAEKGTDGKWRLRSVSTGVDGAWQDPSAVNGETDWSWGYLPDGPPKTDTTSPSAMTGLAPKSRSYGGVDYAAQVQTTSGPEVLIFDRNTRGGMPAITLPGSQPAVSPDGTRVAYVGTNGQILVVATKYAGAVPAGETGQISFGVRQPTDLAWSPDGTRVAFSTPTDVESVAATVTPGATANPTKQESATPGVAAYQNLSAPLAVGRFDGSDPVAASIAVSQASNPTPAAGDFGPMDGSAVSGAVIVATGSDVEAEAAASISGGGPLLFTKPGSLDPRTAAEIDRLFGACVRDKSKDSYCGATHPISLTVVGSTTDIPASVDASLKAKGYNVTRVSAASPYGLSLVGREANPSTVIVVAAADHAAALAATQVAHRDGAVVVLTNGSVVPDAVKPYLAGLASAQQGTGTTKIYAVGSSAVAAMGSSWAGKPKLTVTDVVGADAADAAILLGTETDNGEMLTSLALVPPSGGPSDVALFALGGTGVFPLDPANGLDAAEFTLLQKDASELTTASIVGDPTPYLSAIGQALVTPVNPVVTVNPKAS